MALGQPLRRLCFSARLSLSLACRASKRRPCRMRWPPSRRQRHEGPALRQLESRPRLAAPGPRRRISDGLGVQAHGTACRNRRRDRGLAEDSRRRRHRRLGAHESAERPPYGIDPSVGDQGRTGASRLRPRCATTTGKTLARSRRSRPACWPASSVVKTAGVACRWATTAATSSKASSGAPIPTSKSNSWGSARQRFYFGTRRTTTSMCEILRSSGGSGSPSTRMVSPGMSISLPSPSMK